MPQQLAGGALGYHKWPVDLPTTRGIRAALVAAMLSHEDERARSMQMKVSCSLPHALRCSMHPGNHALAAGVARRRGGKGATVGLPSTRRRAVRRRHGACACTPRLVAPPRRPSPCLPPRQINELEALVGAACSRGVEAARCRDIIEDVVRRARRKGAMLPHLDSALLLSTLEVRWGPLGCKRMLRAGGGRRGQAQHTRPLPGQRNRAAAHAPTGCPCLPLRLPRAAPPPAPLPQQAKSEIAGLTDVALTNAEVMKDELMHHTVRRRRHEGWRAGCRVAPPSRGQLVPLARRLPAGPAPVLLQP